MSIYIYGRLPCHLKCDGSTTLLVTQESRLVLNIEIKMEKGKI